MEIDFFKDKEGNPISTEQLIVDVLDSLNGLKTIIDGYKINCCMSVELMKTFEGYKKSLIITQYPNGSLVVHVDENGFFRIEAKESEEHD